LDDEKISKKKFWEASNSFQSVWLGRLPFIKVKGLTFDRLIIDAGKSFASGQVYVALSRCRLWKDCP
jgi:hypothetical protein